MFFTLGLLPLLTAPAAAVDPTTDGLSHDAPAAYAWDPEHTPLEASATQATDGQFTLRLMPGVAWSSAEVSVSGAGSQDLGPNDGLAFVEIEGIRDHIGPLGVDLLAVAADGRGVSWRFEVQPELLPAGKPPVTLKPGLDKKARKGRTGKRP